MLIQSPSKIIRNDFRIWNKINTNAISEVFNNQILNVYEAVLEVNGEWRINFEEEKTVLILPLYGEIIINDYYHSLFAGTSLTMNLEQGKDLVFKNHIYHDKADILIFVFDKQENISNISRNEIDFTLKNNFRNISESLETPNFIGIYNGRAEGFYTLKNPENSIFGMVINGAFEFQNRLMETRDAILLSEIETLEFEALSENALIIFFEV
ncbi:hypothetical protein [Chryseobacterium sp. YIM B08800]|uniref:pirin family protein n=1 Tax=Chryseobacterium sp. YIM B08800 TaxID=2984136 RepID=UPI00223EE949|nr:hypothetical protein [Chryseobacterium sp. YIM B08800]